MVLHLLVISNSSVTGSSSSTVGNGLSITDWITALATLSVAVFAVVTLLDDWKRRRVLSAERQLERLYSPVFEILDKLLNTRTTADKARHALAISPNDYTQLWETLLRFGYYLEESLHDNLKSELLSPVVTTGERREYLDRGFLECLTRIREQRDRLRRRV